MVGDKIDAQCLFTCSSQASEQDIFVPELSSQNKLIMGNTETSTGPSVNITYILNMYTFIFVLTEEVMLSALVV